MWIEAAITHLGHKGQLPPMVLFERREKEFCAITTHIRHSKILEHLPPGVAEAVASRLLYKQFARGEAF